MQAASREMGINQGRSRRGEGGRAVIVVVEVGRWLGMVVAGVMGRAGWSMEAGT